MVTETRKKPHVTHNSGNQEWYTPPSIIAAARRVLGEIDLDPASSEIANAIVQAKRFYTIVTDGLKHKWCGRVWMNPPYARSLIEPFTSKLVHHFQEGEVTEAIVLTNNATDTKWFQELVSVASAVCFVAGRVKYWGPANAINSPLQGQAITYLGPSREKFASVFQQFGLILYHTT